MSLKDPIILPFYVKISVLLVGFSLLVTILYVAQVIILPLIFALLIAILLNPVITFFVRLKVNRLLAIIITLFITVIILGLLGSFLYSQLNLFSESWPKLVNKFNVLLDQSVTYISGYLDIKPLDIRQWITKTESEIFNTGSAAIGKTIVSVGNVIAFMLLIPVYVFMILYYQPLLLEFLHKIFAKDNQSQMFEIVNQTKTVIMRYLLGLIIEAVIVAILDSAALLILGIKYAILLGILGALLNMIPYIGGIVAVAMPMMVAIVTKDSAWFAVYTMILYYLIQLFDNNYVVPVIVASKVKINALFSMIAVLIGNLLWGIPGMVLSIPLLGVFKLIFDHIESLNPWGYLLGDKMPQPVKKQPFFKKSKKMDK
jgi:predicted PurR-regulated permease PerM